MIITDSAIILHGRKFSDTSKIIHAYTKEHGKISVIAKGVRSAKNTMGSAIEALRCSSITWYKYPNKDLHLLKSAEIAIPLHHITSDYEILMSAMGIIEILSVTQEIEEANSSIYDLAMHALKALNNKQCPESPYIITLLFLMQLTNLMGFAIHVRFCPITGEKIIIGEEDQILFSLSHGGCVSNEALLPDRDCLLLNSSAVGILQALEDCTFENISMKCSLQDQMSLLDLFQRYFSFHSHKTYRWNTYPPGISTH
jgi:DNA repair protein RecO (recombination protein O)